MSDSITGTWVTSFNLWLHNSRTDPLYPFRIANNRFASWIKPTDWETIWGQYFPDNPNTPLVAGAEDEHFVLSLLNPVPTATLSCFKFNRDNTFEVWVKANNMERRDESKFHGDYGLVWNDEFSVTSGTMTLREYSDLSIHNTIEFLVRSRDEIDFIIAYKRTTDEGAPSGAGTLRRVPLRPWYWPKDRTWPSLA